MTLDNQYHCCVKSIGRASGRSAIAAAAYRAGARLHDGRSGLTHDYTRKRGVMHAEIIAPEGCDWALDRQALWAAVETAATRKNARLASEIEVSLNAAALSDAQRLDLVRTFARDLAAEGIAVDFAIHAPPTRRQGDADDLPGGSGLNYHAHILCTHAILTPDGPAKATSRLASGPAAVEMIRQRWEDHTNAALAAAGSDLRQDHRSLAAQGIARTPTRHLGAATIAQERRGRPTERAEIHRARQEQRRAGIAVAALSGEQQRRAERRRAPPEEPPPASPPAAPPPLQQQETPAMPQKYSPRGRVTGRGGRPLPRPPQHPEPRQPHEQTDDLRAWLWSKAYGPAAMPKNWLMATTAMWTFASDGDPDGIHVQLSGDAGRLHDSGSAVTWSHADAPTDEQRATAIEAMLDLAEARAWSALSFVGSEEFREEAARRATRRGLTVTDEDLQAFCQAERRRLAEQQSTAPTLASGAGAGIAQAPPLVPAAIAAAVAPAQPSSPTITAFLAAGREARSTGADADVWVALYAARLSADQRAEIADHLAPQPAASARWEQATNDALTADSLAAAQQRGDTRSLRSVFDVTPPERRRIVGDLLHERADAALSGEVGDLTDMRRRGAAQALAQTWDRVCDESDRAERDAARVEESPPPPPTVADIRRLGETLVAAQRAERAGTGDPFDSMRADTALRRALDRAVPETRRALADALTARPSGKADPLASTLAVAAVAADDRATGLAGMTDDQRAAIRPPLPGQRAEPEDEPGNNNEYDTTQPDFMV